MGKAQAQSEHPGFEMAWEILMEDREHLRETDRILKETAEQRKKFAEEHAADIKEIRRINKEAAEEHAADIKEIRRINKEAAEEHAADMEEIRRINKEAVEEHAADIKEIRRILKETNKAIGSLGNRFGEVIEYMVEPNLLVKFQKLGFDFDKITHGTKIKDKQDKTIAEADYSIENYDKVMLVEVKIKPDIDDIEYHIRRIEKFRAYADLHNDRRIFLGAVAGTVINDNVKNHALKNGLYIIQPSGKTFVITVPEGIYSPREW